VTIRNARPRPTAEARPATFQPKFTQHNLNSKPATSLRYFATAATATARTPKRPEGNKVRALNIEIEEAELDRTVLEPQMILHKKRWQGKLKGEEPEVPHMAAEEQNKIVAAAAQAEAAPKSDPSNVTDEDVAEVLHYLSRGTDQAPAAQDDRWLIKEPADELPVNEVLDVGRHCKIVKGSLYTICPLFPRAFDLGMFGLTRADFFALRWPVILF